VIGEQRITTRSVHPAQTSQALVLTSAVGQSRGGAAEFAAFESGDVGSRSTIGQHAEDALRRQREERRGYEPASDRPVPAGTMRFRKRQ